MKLTNQINHTNLRRIKNMHGELQSHRVEVIVSHVDSIVFGLGYMETPYVRRNIASLREWLDKLEGNLK